MAVVLSRDLLMRVSPKYLAHESRLISTFPQIISSWKWQEKCGGFLCDGLSACNFCHEWFSILLYGRFRKHHRVRQHEYTKISWCPLFYFLTKIAQNSIQLEIKLFVVVYWISVRISLFGVEQASQRARNVWCFCTVKQKLFAMISSNVFLKKITNKTKPH